ncbi:tRNA lysidine(34) synthetase TilS [Microbulbifer bruguierae]|uniref:tRNA(Ile)-lysidine synthase n=1 Tax=Microbulbifer bruguierae TaxID=3029061 RepID=A0ABY8NFB2_9GAMM|nr:tRNA lysidine(34) synthetase TilS [Microbulbifer bruguierae]WGL17624.1 tRNA lysidine(34) synthetase TilS [Microbulbifer bruguierae]
MTAVSEKLISLLGDALKRHPAPGRLWLGYSGGLDSTVLLHLLCRVQVPFGAVHVNHGLSARADEWQAHCEEVAGKLGVPLVARNVEVRRKEGGLEQAARKARYGAFDMVMAPGDQLLLAQHGDDQAETFLLRLLRGAGVLGLGAMAEWRSVGDPDEGRSLLRPLLGASRAELECYARASGLEWVEDDSNSDLALDRNYIRKQVVPPLAARWPLLERVSRSAENLREAAGLLQDLAGEDLQRCGVRRESFGLSIDLAAFLALSNARQKNLLRGWLHNCGAPMPEAAHLQQALHQAQAVEDAIPAVPLGGMVLRRYRDRLFLTPQLQPRERFDEVEWQWDGVHELKLSEGWILAPSPDWPAADYMVQFRRGGERAKPRERHHSQTLKRLLQEYALPPWLRDRVPLVFRGETLVAVGDLFVTVDGPVSPPIWRFLD